MNKFKKISIIASALAVIGVTVNYASAGASASVFRGAINPQLIGINSSLMLYFQPIYGATNIRVLLDSINQNLDYKLKQNDGANSTLDKNQRATISQKIRMERDFNRLPDAAGCSEATSGGGRAGGATGTAATAKADQDKLLDKVKTYENSNETYEDLLNAKDTLGTCSAADIAEGRKTGGCSGVGAYPNADVNAASLTVAPGSAINYSYTPEQKKVVDQLILNLTSHRVPLKVSKKMEDTPEGKYVAAQNYVYTARLSSAINSLNNIAAFKTSNEKVSNVSSTSGNTFSSESWPSIQSKYNELFPGQTFPTKPSEYELLRYEVFNRYGDTDGWIVDSTTFTKEEALREIMRINVISQYIQHLQMQRLEDRNILQSTLAAQYLNPITTNRVN